MTFIDLFSGIGGFRRGLERSGHKCVGHVEIDKYANKSYCAMYELLPCKFRNDTGANSCMLCNSEVNKNCDGKSCNGEWYAKDIKRIGAGEVPKAEIWTFGFPCTDISIAGRMAGLHGERSGLFFTVIGLLKGQNPENRPARLIVENVKHLVSSERGGAFTAVLSELWEAGYDCEWQIVNSKDFGVPQHRERVYLVGHLRGQRTGEVFPVGGANETPVKQILGKSQGNRLYDPTGLSVTMTANGGGFAGRTGLYSVSVNRIDGIKDCIDTAHTLTASDTRGINRNQDQNAVIEEKPPCAYFIDMNEQARITEHARCIKARQYAGVSNHKGETSGVFLCHGSLVCVRAVITPNREEKRQNGRRIKDPGEPCFTLTAQDQHGILLCCCEGWKQGLPIREAKKDGYTMAYHGDGINALQETSDSIKRTQYFNVLTYCWEQMSRDRTERVLLICDECYLMIDQKVPQSLVYLRNVMKRARKYEGALAIISHSVIDFLDPAVKQYGQALLDIPCYKLLMGTDGPNLKETANLYDLTEAEQELLLAKKRGHALFMVGAKRLHINFEIPDYKMEYMGKAGGR